MVSYGDKLAVAGRGFTSANQKAMYLMILDRQGQIIRQVAYRSPQLTQLRPYQVARCSDGGFAVGLTHTDFLQSLIVKTDSLGAIEWVKQMNTGGTRQIFDIKPTRDGNLLIGGNIREQCFLAKLNLRGQLLWDRRWGSNSSLNVVYSIGELSDGTILTHGYLFLNNVRVRQLSRLTASGQLQWVRGFGSTNFDEVGYGREVEGDTALILSGYCFSPGITNTVDIRLSRVTTQGQVRWHKSFVGPGADQVNIGPNHTAILGRGRYLVGGMSGSPNGERPVRSVIVGFTDERDLGCNPPPNLTIDQNLIIERNETGVLLLSDFTGLTPISLNLTRMSVAPCRYAGCGNTSNQFDPVRARLNCGFVTLDAQNPGFRYLWSTGDTSRTIRIDQSRLYWVRVTGPCGSVTDSIRVTVPAPVQTDSIRVIQVNPCQPPILSAQNAGARYLWSTGDTTATISLTASGLYTVDVTTPCGTTRLRYLYQAPPLPPKPILTVSGDTCGGPIALTYGPTPPGSLILWTTGSEGPITQATATGMVRVTALYPPCYRWRDSVRVWIRQPGDPGPGGLRYCLDSVLTIPNIVTPGPASGHGDGFNDRLRIPTLWAYPGHQLRIYNRYGQLAHEAAPYRGDWPGKDVPPGIYFYHLTLPEGLPPRRGWIEVVR